MSTENRLLIKDSCIIFDLIDLNLLDAFFLLEFVTFTTDQVINEIKLPEQRLKVNEYIVVGKLLIDDQGSLDDIYKLFYENPGLSFADCSVLECALRRNGILISADKSLRKVGKEKHLTVRGVLWIIEQLVEKRIISKSSAIEILQLYPSINKRVPVKEILNLISILSGH